MMAICLGQMVVVCLGQMAAASGLQFIFAFKCLFTWYINIWNKVITRSG